MVDAASSLQQLVMEKLNFRHERAPALFAGVDGNAMPVGESSFRVVLV